MEARAKPRSPLTWSATRHKSTICRTIKQDIDYPSYRKCHCMLITEACKETRKVSAAALLSEIEHESGGMFRLFSNEKNFDLYQMSKKQNERWIFKFIEEVPVVEIIKFPTSAIGFGVISNEGTSYPCSSSSRA